MDDFDKERRQRGLDTYHRVYGDNAPKPPEGSGDFFDKVIIDQHFAEIWSREALPFSARRLLTIGVLTEKGMYDVIQFQFERALELGELSPEQVHEVVMHLVAYSGGPVSGGLNNAAVNAIEKHRLSTGDA